MESVDATSIPVPLITNKQINVLIIKIMLNSYNLKDIQNTIFFFNEIFLESSPQKIFLAFTSKYLSKQSDFSLNKKL